MFTLSLIGMLNGGPALAGEAPPAELVASPCVVQHDQALKNDCLSEHHAEIFAAAQKTCQDKTGAEKRQCIIGHFKSHGLRIVNAPPPAQPAGE